MIQPFLGNSWLRHSSTIDAAAPLPNLPDEGWQSLQVGIGQSELGFEIAYVEDPDIRVTVEALHALPEFLLVSSPAYHQECSGCYHIVADLFVNSLPVYQQCTGDRFLFASQTGNWHIASSAARDCGFNCKMGYICSSVRHGGRTPSELPGACWCRMDTSDFSFVPDGQITVTRHNLLDTCWTATVVGGDVERQGDFLPMPNVFVHGHPVFYEASGERFLYRFAHDRWYVADNLAAVAPRQGDGARYTGHAQFEISGRIHPSCVVSPFDEIVALRSIICAERKRMDADNLSLKEDKRALEEERRKWEEEIQRLEDVKQRQAKLLQAEIRDAKALKQALHDERARTLQVEQARHSNIHTMHGFQFQYEAGGVWCSVSSEANDYYWTSYLAYLQGDETVAQVESGAAKYQ